MWWVDLRRKSRVIGLVKDMTKSDAGTVVDQIVTEAAAKREENRVWRFGEFVAKVYFPYYSRKWKDSTKENNVNRVSVHLVSEFGPLELSGFRRDELQDLQDAKAHSGLSFSVVDHLRWDMKQIFDMAVAEGQIERNPALLLFTPKDAAKPVRRVMNIIGGAKLFRGARPEKKVDRQARRHRRDASRRNIRADLGRMAATYADIQQRVYRGAIDTPKTGQSIRQAALPEGLLRDIEVWREFSVKTSASAWVFPSERMTPLSKDNCWRRSMYPKLRLVGLGWANFLVMRRSHATLMKALGGDGKLVADQLGHSLDVNQNVYTQSPVESRQAAVNQLEKTLQVM